MSLRAIGNPGIDAIRAAVPEFEDAFQEELREKRESLVPSRR
jgi:hypothetical protein